MHTISTFLSKVIGCTIVCLLANAAFAQCPTLINTANGGNGTAPLVVCNGAAIHLQSVGNLPAGSTINWYIDNSATYTPPAQGTLVGNTSNTVGVNCPAVCPNMVAVFINACNGTGNEQDNEYIVFGSGSGFVVNDLQVDLPNNVGGANNDINLGTASCGYQTPSAAFITALRAAAGCSTIYAAGPGSSVPAGAAVVLFTSDAVTANYNFNGLCSSNQAIYIMQSNCHRTAGAFVNAKTCDADPLNRLRTTTISINNCTTCSSHLTYSRCGLSNSDGEFAIQVAGSDTASVSNGGVLIDGTNPCNGPNFLTVPVPPDTLRLTFYANNLCNQTAYLRGVLTPTPAGCPTTVLTQAFPIQVVCPTPAIAGLTTVCSNAASNTLTVNGGTFSTIKWDTPTSSNITATTVNALQTGTYTATVTGTGGCTASATFAVAVNAAPLPTLTGNDFFCVGGSTVLTVSSPFSSYNWSVTPSNTTNTLTVTTTGTYSVTVTDANNCTGVSTKTIRSSSITPTITGNLSYCTGGSTTLTCNPSSGATYSWNTGAITASVSANTATPYCVTATNADGCTGSTCQIAIESPLPTPTINGNPIVCVNTTINNLQVNGGTFSTIKWDTPTSSNITATTVNALQTGTYTATVTTASGCTASATFAVTVSAVPTPTISGSTAFCAGANSTLSVPATYQGYSWSAVPPNTQPSIVVTTGGVYTVIVSNIDACTSSASITVTQNALPIISFNAPATACDGASLATISASDNGQPIGTYLWANGLGSNNQIAPQIVSSSNHIFTVTVTNAAACSASASLTIAILPNPIVTINAPQLTVCAGQAVTLTAAGASAFSWTTGATSASISPTPTAPANTYTVTATNNSNCSATASITIAVSTAPIAAINAATAICEGQSVSLTATGGGTYTWSNSLGTNNVVTASPTATTTYSVTVTNAIGCSTVASKQVIVHQNPAPVTLTAEPICQGGSTDVQVTSATNGLSFAWNTAGTGTFINTATAGVYTVTATDINGCKNTGSTTVILIISPVSYAGRDTTIVLGQQVQLLGTVVSSPTPNLVYHWEPAASLNNQNLQNPIATPSQTTTYVFHVHTLPGECESAEDEVTVTVVENLGCLSTDEGFTPNGDGKNDTWTIACLQNEQNTTQVFNRWGELVFKATNYYNTFDGKINGQLLPDGTYYYVIQTKSRTFKGTLSILR